VVRYRERVKPGATALRRAFATVSRPPARERASHPAATVSG